MPNEVAGEDTGAFPADLHAAELPPDWDVPQTLAWIAHRGRPLAAEQADDDAILDRALEVLNNAVRAGKIVARGRPSSSHARPQAHRPREPIPADVIDELRRIDAAGWCCTRSDTPNFAWLHDEGPFFYDVCLRAADVKGLWPAQIPPVDVWMREYATEFLTKNGRPPSRNNEAVPDAQKAGFAVHPAREAYARLPSDLKVPNRKPRQPKLK
jgi:hypothetical protein